MNHPSPDVTTSKKDMLGILIGAILSFLGLGFSIYGYLARNSETYKQNLKLAKAGTIQGNNALMDNFFIYGMLLTLVGFLILITNVYLKKSQKASRISSVKTSTTILTLTQAALMAALCYIGFQYFRIDIPVGTEKTAIHFGNTFCVLGALLLGGVWGGLSGAVGMTIADLTSSYVTSAPKTFLLKLCIGLIVGFLAHKIGHLSTSTERSHTTKWTIISCIGGMLFNVFADPIVGYYYKTYLLGVPQDLSMTLTKIGSLATLVNAITSVVIASTLYLALRPALRKTGLLHTIKTN